MKQYDHFGEYMFDLLLAPLKKGKRAVNQFFIFFKVIGRVFDGLKEDALRVRDETNIATASPVMLPVHGQDRNMPRLAGESVEGYRTRLAMKGIIAEKGGLKAGILYALAAMGYEHSYIEPLSYSDPAHWAEFVVHLGEGSANAVRSPYSIFCEIQRVKEASSRLSTIAFSLDVPPAVMAAAAHSKWDASMEVWPRVVNELESRATAAIGGNLEYHACLELYSIKEGESI